MCFQNIPKIPSLWLWGKRCRRFHYIRHSYALRSPPHMSMNFFASARCDERGCECHTPDSGVFCCNLVIFAIFQSLNCLPFFTSDDCKSFQRTKGMFYYFILRTIVCTFTKRCKRCGSQTFHWRCRFRPSSNGERSVGVNPNSDIARRGLCLRYIRNAICAKVLFF